MKQTIKKIKALTRKIQAVKKTKNAKKVLQLMDEDWEYVDAVKKVCKENNIDKKQLEKELDPFI